MPSAAEQLVDEILVVDAQCGSRQACEALVSRWQRRLWAHAYRLTHRPEAAWDITQESWLDIVRGLGRLKDPAHFGSWAYRIVSHKAYDWLRRNGRETTQDEVLEPEDMLSSASGQEQRDTAGDVHGVLRRLPGRSQVVLNLYYLEGFGVAEIAAILDMPEGTVKSRLHTARTQFRTLWEALVGTPPASIPATTKWKTT